MESLQFLLWHLYLGFFGKLFMMLVSWLRYLSTIYMKFRNRQNESMTLKSEYWLLEDSDRKETWRGLWLLITFWFFIWGLVMGVHSLWEYIELSIYNVSNVYFSKNINLKNIYIHNPTFTAESRRIRLYISISMINQWMTISMICYSTHLPTFTNEGC